MQCKTKTSIAKDNKDINPKGNVNTIVEEKQSETYPEPEDTPECLHQFQSALPRNLSVIPNHMLMNKDKKGKAREAGGMNNEETGKSYIFAQHYRSKPFHFF